MAADGTPGTKNQPQFLETGAPDLAVDSNLISNYAAKVGNRRTGTTAQMNATTGADKWEGLEWGNTDNWLNYKVINGNWEAPFVGRMTLFIWSRANVDNTRQYPALVIDPGNSTNTTQAAFSRSDGTDPDGRGGLLIGGSGVYLIQAALRLNAVAGGRTFIQIGDDNNAYFARTSFPAGEGAASVSAIVRVDANTLVPISFQKSNGDLGANTGNVTVTRLS
jgi:hypothetical protein